MKRRVLNAAFFERPVLEVAPDLLGKYLVRRIDGKTYALLITETEAYDGVKDKACKASRGRTPSCEPMFGKAGRWYVYFTYGMHFMLNIVTGGEGYPAAVLFRGAGLKPGDTRFARSVSSEETDLGEIVGPGRLTRELRIDRLLNTKKAAPGSGLWVEDRGAKIAKSQIKRTPRIGIDSAGPVWAKKPYRFVLKK